LSATGMQAAAQKVESLQAGIRTGKTQAHSSAVPSPAGRRGTLNDRVVHHALVGAAIGAAVGFTTALITTNQEQVKDHSEDGLAYLYLTASGAVIGLVIGAIIGAAWR